MSGVSTVGHVTNFQCSPLLYCKRSRYSNRTVKHSIMQADRGGGVSSAELEHLFVSLGSAKLFLAVRCVDH